MYALIGVHLKDWQDILKQVLLLLYCTLLNLGKILHYNEVFYIF